MDDYVLRSVCNSVPSTYDTHIRNKYEAIRKREGEKKKRDRCCGLTKVDAAATVYTDYKGKRNGGKRGEIDRKLLCCRLIIHGSVKPYLFNVQCSFLDYIPKQNQLSILLDNTQCLIPLGKKRSGIPWFPFHLLAPIFPETPPHHLPC